MRGRDTDAEEVAQRRHAWLAAAADQLVHVCAGHLARHNLQCVTMGVLTGRHALSCRSWSSVSMSTWPVTFARHCDAVCERLDSGTHVNKVGREAQLRDVADGYPVAEALAAGCAH